jgi:hypothetical protein
MALGIRGLRIQTWGTHSVVGLPSPVPEGEGPGAPSSKFGTMPETGATSHLGAGFRGAI